jgi:hypothetical protein
VAGVERQIRVALAAQGAPGTREGLTEEKISNAFCWWWDKKPAIEDIMCRRDAQKGFEAGVAWALAQPGAPTKGQAKQ